MATHAINAEKHSEREERKMGTENQNDVNGIQNQEGAGTARTFTQEEVNRIVQNRVAKFGDYEDLKAKAAKFDKMEEENKSELEKMKDRADQLQKQVDSMQKAETVRKMRESVAAETNIPVNLLTGETEEECKEQAQKIMEFAKPNAYPSVKDAGEAQGKTKRQTREQFAEWFNKQ